MNQYNAVAMKLSTLQREGSLGVKVVAIERDGPLVQI